MDVKQSARHHRSASRRGRAEHRAQRAGPGAIFQKDGNELKWVVDLDPRLRATSSACYPATTRWSTAPTARTRPSFSIEKDFTITGGQSTTVNLRTHDHYPILDQKDTRSGFGAGLLELGKRRTRMWWRFARTSPAR